MTVILVPALMFAFVPNAVFGLAGLSEQDTEYYYSPKILIAFNTPSDFCPPEYGDQNCILIYGAQDTYGPKQFDIDRLTTVNVPQSAEPQYIIGKSYEDRDWLIWDLETDEQVVKDPSYARVAATWEKLGNAKPAFVDIDNYSRYFHAETEKCKRESAEMNKMGREFLFVMWVGPLIM
jgi:hypothetical protein